MAVRTNFELFDFITSGYDLSITATDKDGVTQTVSSTDNTKRYFLHKYGTRIYPVLTGMNSATPEIAMANFTEDFRCWVNNRQRNIDLQYQALYDYDYSPIDNYDRREIETIDDDGTTTYGRRDTESGSDSITYGKKSTESGSDSITYGKKSTESGSDSLQHGHVLTTETDDVVHNTGQDTTTKDGYETHNTEKAGFNAPNDYTPDTKTTDTYNNVRDVSVYGKNVTEDKTETETNSGTDTTNYGKVDTLSGSDTNNYGKVDTLSGSDTTTYGKTNTQSGSDSTTKDIERSLHAYGNIGVTTSTAMISELIEARMMSLADMLLDNFIDDYTYYS